VRTILKMIVDTTNSNGILLSEAVAETAKANQSVNVKLSFRKIIECLRPKPVLLKSKNLNK
jgi:hypothetical protein